MQKQEYGDGIWNLKSKKNKNGSNNKRRSIPRKRNKK